MTSLPGVHVVRVTLAAAAVGLVVLSVPVLRAEWVYGRARGFGTTPSDDLTGRVEAYAVAARLDPSEAAYLLRRGQILLGRARRDPAFLQDALRDLSRAAELQPIDPRVRSELAEALLRSGDTLAARRESDVSLRLGPRHSRVHASAVELRLRLWRARRDAEDLRAALSASRVSDGLGDQHPSRTLARFVARSGPLAAADLMEATSSDSGLRAYAARLMQAENADLARVLSAPVKEPR